MKIRNFLLASLAAAFITNSASAATIDMGSVFVGQSGQLSDFTNNSGSPSFYDSIVTGVLPNNSQITFSYAQSGFTGTLASQGDYNFHNLTTHFDGSTISSSTGIGASAGHISPVGSSVITPVDSLVLSSANLSVNSGTASISNTSISTANFAAMLLGFLTNGGRSVVSFTVTALSNVPLPASAYMFGMGLLALAGMSYKRKQATA